MANGYDNTFIGSGPIMEGLRKSIKRLSGIRSPVVIFGDTGTGKELVARLIHSSGTRSRGPFVPINCGAMPEQLLESELFGHVKGAFTGAVTTNGGLVMAAQGGTLFLDEIGEMPMSSQVKLLRVLQDRAVRAVGATQEQQVDVRVIAATNRRLEEAVREGKFRADLYYRLAVVRIDIPSLRERPEDILALIERCLDKLPETVGGGDKKTLDDEALRILTSYSWPGNVRQLENVLEGAYVRASGDEIRAEHLDDAVRSYAARERMESDLSSIMDRQDGSMLKMEEVERLYILRVLEAVGGNKTQAAEVLGFDRKTLYRKLERFNQEGNGAIAEHGGFNGSSATAMPAD